MELQRAEEKEDERSLSTTGDETSPPQEGPPLVDSIHSDSNISKSKRIETDNFLESVAIVVPARRFKTVYSSDREQLNKSMDQFSDEKLGKRAPKFANFSYLFQRCTLITSYHAQMDRMINSHFDERKSRLQAIADRFKESEITNSSSPLSKPATK